MAIRVRGKSLYIDVQVSRTGQDGKPEKVRHREPFKGTPSEAEAREAAITAALLAGHSPDELRQRAAPSNLTLKQALDATWERSWRGKGVERTVLSNMKDCEAFFGANTPLASITADDADRFVAELRKRGLAASTIRSKCSVMTKTLRHYKRRGIISQDVHFDLPSVGDNLRDRVITPAEEKVLLELFTTRWDVVSKRRADGTPGQDYADLWAFMLDTGARPSEVRAADARNLRGDLLTLRETKNGRSRTIPLTPRALAAWKRQEERHGNTPWAWATKDTVRHGWEWARSAMGLLRDDGFIPYALRHTCATRLYAATRDLLVVQKWMGHTDIKMTLRYAKLLPGDLERARDLLTPFTPGVLLAA